MSVVLFLITDERGCHVVVDNDLMALPVAFSRSEDYSTGIFEHRDEIGYYDGLREQVFVGTEQCRPLPFPAQCALVVVAAVACPYGEMTASEPMSDGTGLRDIEG